MLLLGLFHIDGVGGADSLVVPQGAFGRMQEASKGKDTTIGHWEIAGHISKKPMPTYPKGFPDEIICEFEKRTGRKVLCNQPYSGSEVIKKYGKEHMRTGALIVYTSADSVFQIAVFFYNSNYFFNIICAKAVFKLHNSHFAISAANSEIFAESRNFKVAPER